MENNSVSQTSISRFFDRLWNDILDIRSGSDAEATIEGIKKDISFRGTTAWILIIAIFIASIGLNANSTAVIIGAMLISPLMGPILGVGLSVAIQDFDTLIRSLKNLLIAVTIALVTSTFYFLITPLDVAQSEILARTKPTILDVLIAFFGGLAGILAGSRKEKTNVIPGVAIATALMPPLCTAGFGLAHFDFKIFFGAFYLFFINSVFISLSTFLVVKYLRFPIVTFLDSEKIKRAKIGVSIFVLITIVPSTVIFYYVIQETRFKVSAENFVNKEVNLGTSQLINYKIKYVKDVSSIELFFIGEYVSKTDQKILQEKLSFYGLTGDKLFNPTDSTILFIHQQAKNTEDEVFNKKLMEIDNQSKVEIIREVYNQSEKTMKEKDKTIKNLKDQLARYQKEDDIPYDQLKKELDFHFPNIIQSFSCGNVTDIIPLKNNQTKKVSSLLFVLNIKSKTKKSDIKNKKEEIEQWLRIRLQKSNIRVILV